MPLRNPGRRNSIANQQDGIIRWLMKFGERRASEAAVEVTKYSTRRRRMMFNSLRTIGCIEYQGDRWMPVKSLDQARDLQVGGDK